MTSDSRGQNVVQCGSTKVTITFAPPSESGCPSGVCNLSAGAACSPAAHVMPPSLLVCFGVPVDERSANASDTAARAASGTAATSAQRVVRLIASECKRSNRLDGERGRRDPAEQRGELVQRPEAVEAADPHRPADVSTEDERRLAGQSLDRRAADAHGLDVLEEERVRVLEPLEADPVRADLETSGLGLAAVVPDHAVARDRANLHASTMRRRARRGIGSAAD